MLTGLLFWMEFCRPQSHDWNNGTNGGCQLGSRDVRKIAPTASLAYQHDLAHCVGAFWHHGYSKDALAGYFCPLPPHPAYPTSPPISPTPSVSYTYMNGKNTIKFSCQGFEG